MLVFDPTKRITIEEALKHKYFSKLHQPDDEPTGEVVSRFDFDFELYSLKTNEYKELLYEEIMLYHDEAAVTKYLKVKAEHPDGVLHTRYGKDRLRTMYKGDQELVIDGELAFKKK